MKAEPMKAGSSSSDCPWHRRARDAVGYSLHLRLVLVFMAIALIVTLAFKANVDAQGGGHLDVLGDRRDLLG